METKYKILTYLEIFLTIVNEGNREGILMLSLEWSVLELSTLLSRKNTDDTAPRCEGIREALLISKGASLIPVKTVLHITESWLSLPES